MTPQEARALFDLLDLIDDAACTAHVATLKSVVKRIIRQLVQE